MPGSIRASISRRGRRDVHAHRRSAARRLDAFKRNRRGFSAFWFFLLAFVLSLGAEFIANDRPILASYKGELLFPALVDYPEDKFGGFLAETDYRDPVIFKEIEAHGWMHLAADPLFLQHP